MQSKQVHGSKFLNVVGREICAANGDPHKLRQALRHIQGENYSHYARPTQSKLGNDGRQLIHCWMHNNDPAMKRVFAMQRFLLEAIEAVESEWFRQRVDLQDTPIEVRDNRAHFLFKSRY
mmetsp:Transcript_11172/g.30834  ORF Transcript_11172/g.30834 Transcript_11172/m.30834 type:complete len:120 (-) Transcript_11172:1718-2077(-)